MKTKTFNSRMTSFLTSLCGQRALWLLVFIAAMATRAQAQYVLWIGTETRYETSVDNIESTFLKSGKMSFDATQGVVTLDNVVYENPATGIDGDFFSLDYPGVTGRPAKIILKGENKVTCAGIHPIELSMVDCTIVRETGSGYTSKNCVLEINCTNKTATALRLNKASLLISNCTVKAYGGYYGIGDQGYDVSQKLTTFQSNTLAKGSKGSIANIYTLTLGMGTSIRRPAGAAFNSSLHGVALDGKLVTDEVLICESDYKDDDKAPVPGNMSVTTYGSDGSAHISWEPATDDKTAQANLEYRLSYKKQGDDSEWVTVINWQKGVYACNITGLQQDAWYYMSLDVRDEADNLGYYSWTGFRIPIFYGFWVGGNEVNDGNFSDIPITSGKASYDPSSKMLTLTNANIVTSGNEEYGIYNSSLSYLTIKPVGTNNIIAEDFGLRIDCNTYINGSEGGTLIIQSKYEKAIRGDDNAELRLNNCHIESPAFAKYDNTKGRVISWSGSEVNGSVTFAPGNAYDLYLTTFVTLTNKENIKSPDIKSGKASYDSVTKTLTLDNVNAVCNDDCIMSFIDGLTVKLVGENKLFTGRGETIWLLASATFTGDGSLTVEADDGDGILIGNNNVTMTIDHTTMRIASNYDSSAIFGLSAYSNKKVVIDYSKVTLYSAGTEATVTGLDDFELKRCAFESADYYFDSSKGAICDNSIGGYPAGQSEIVIVPAGDTDDNVAYAEYTDADKTLTFYYDTKKDVRSGAIYTTPSEWSAVKGKATKAVFDPSFAAYEIESCRNWFVNFTKLTSITGINFLNTAKVKNMSYMFSNCSSLTSLDVSQLNTSSVTIMTGMFYGCSALTALYMSKFDTGNVTDMANMFRSCKKLNIIDVSQFNTAKVKNFTGMFRDCENVTELDLTRFNTSSATNLSYMFSNCKSLARIDVTGFRTGNVNNMSNMFDGCSSLTDIDLIYFNMNKVEDVTRMFASCGELTTIYCNKDWNDLPSLLWSDELFQDCTKLKGEKGTSYNASMVGLDFARPDGGTEIPGYFTKKAIKGDVNDDSTVDVADIACVIDYMAGKTEVSKERADVNGDKNVDVADIATIIDIMAGK